MNLPAFRPHRWQPPPDERGPGVRDAITFRPFNHGAPVSKFLGAARKAIFNCELVDWLAYPASGEVVMDSFRIYTATKHQAQTARQYLQGA